MGGAVDQHTLERILLFWLAQHETPVADSEI